MEGTRGDKQDVIGTHHAVLGGDGAALNQRQQVTLHAFARYVGAHGFRTPRDLVELVDKDDAVLLDVLNRLQLELFLVDHLGGFLVDEDLERVFDLELAAAGLVARHVLEHTLQLAGHLLHAGRRHDLDAHWRRQCLDLDLLVVQLALAQHLAKFLTGSRFLAFIPVFAPAG